MSEYIRVAEEEGEDIIEIPLEADGTLLLTTLNAQFAGACGLKYRHPETKSMRGVRLVEDRLVPPEEGWEYDFFCSFPKSDGKRKSSELLESNTYKTKRLDGFRKCSDLIVLGLPWKTTEQELKDHFSLYGEVLMAQIKKDMKTGQSKGYGFIRFEDFDVQRRVLAMRHVIDGRTCDVKVPNSKDGGNPFLSGKVFVGRTTEDITSADLRDYFEKFGEVTDVFIPKPFRAFSFVTFLDPEIAQRLCGEDHIIKGVSVNVSSATPKGENMRGNYGSRGGAYGSDRGPYNMGGGGGGGSGGQNWNQGRGWNSGGSRGSQSTWNQGQGWNSGNGGGNWNPNDMSNFDPKNINMNALTVPIMAALSQQLLGNMGQAMQAPPQSQQQQQQAPAPQQQAPPPPIDGQQSSGGYSQSQGYSQPPAMQQSGGGGGGGGNWSSSGRSSERYSR